MTNEPLKLLPCPFCAGGAMVTVQKDTDSFFRYAIYCPVCLGWQSDRQDAIDKWNRRAPLPGMPGREALLAAEAVISPHCGDWGKKDCGAPDCALQQVAAWLRKIGEGK